MTHRPHMGVFLPTMSPAGVVPADVVDAARHAEALGFESVWVVDQLVAGSGAPALIDSIVALSAVAGATDRIRLGLGVMIVPLRPVAWVAKQVGSLQHVSGGRVLFGAGVGGDRHGRSWSAAGVSRAERAARTDAALAVLPDLLAGKPAALPDVAGAPVVQLSPGVDAPPILVGGASDAALRRAVRHGDGWFALPAPPEAARPSVERLVQLAADTDRPVPSVTGSIVIALEDDPSRPPEPEVVDALTDPDGLYGMPADGVPAVLVTGTADLRDRVTGWSALGAERVVLTVAAGDWHRQTELAAAALLGGRPLRSARPLPRRDRAHLA